MELTNPLEEYLKTMYVLQNTEGQIRVTDIARKLDCTKPSVNRALNTLKSNGLVHYEAYGKIALTRRRNQKGESHYETIRYLKIVLA